MTEFLNLIIIFGAFIVFFVFKKTKNYLSWRGGTLVLLVIILFILKLISGADLASLGLRSDNYLDTLLPTFIFTVLGALILITIRFKAKKFKVGKWGWDAKGIKFGFLTLFGGAVWTILFLTSPNILLLGASHAILASLYYFIVYEHNIIEERLVFWPRKNLWQKIFG